eukprot:scaffold33210_cov148-Skeletonema_menzelii.AAC.2
MKHEANPPISNPAQPNKTFCPSVFGIIHTRSSSTLNALTASSPNSPEPSLYSVDSYSEASQNDRRRDNFFYATVITHILPFRLVNDQFTHELDTIGVL